MLDEIGVPDAILAGGLNQAQHRIKLVKAREYERFLCLLLASDLNLFLLDVQEIAEDIEPILP